MADINDGIDILEDLIERAATAKMAINRQPKRSATRKSGPFSLPKAPSGRASRGNSKTKYSASARPSPSGREARQARYTARGSA